MKICQIFLFFHHNYITHETYNDKHFMNSLLNLQMASKYGGVIYVECTTNVTNCQLFNYERVTMGMVYRIKALEWKSVDSINSIWYNFYDR